MGAPLQDFLIHCCLSMQNFEIWLMSVANCRSLGELKIIRIPYDITPKRIRPGIGRSTDCPDQSKWKLFSVQNHDTYYVSLVFYNTMLNHNVWRHNLLVRLSIRLSVSIVLSLLPSLFLSPLFTHWHDHQTWSRNYNWLLCLMGLRGDFRKSVLKFFVANLSQILKDTVMCEILSLKT